MILFYQILSAIIGLTLGAIIFRIYFKWRERKMIREHKKRMRSKIPKNLFSEMMNRDIDSIYDDEIEKHYSK